MYTRWTQRTALLGAVGLGLVAAGPAHADSYAFGYSAGTHAGLVINGSTTIDDNDVQGWVSDQDGNIGGPGNNDNYLVGTIGTAHFNDYFAFDISSLASPVTSAALSLDSFAITDPLTYRLGDATSVAGSLPNASSPDTALYAALGAGTEFGTFALTPGQSYTTLTLTLNAAAVAALNNAITNGVTTFALGGTVNAVPEPASWALMILGLGMIGTVVRRRQADTPALV